LPVYYNYKNSSKHDYLEGSASPLYNFGYGLSYSNFVYSELITAVNEGNELTVNISLKVTNTSNKDGDEVVQLYVSDEVSSVATPVKQLKAFKRVNIKAGETKQVVFTLHQSDLTLFNQQMKEVVEAGDFNIQVGAGSSEIRLKKIININQNYKL